MIYGLLILIAIGSRLLPHPVNVAPIAALALFVGSTALDARSNGNKLLAYALPFLALLVSDWLIGFYTWPVMAVVYGCYGLSVVIGFFVRKNFKAMTIVSGALASSVIFFLLTNAAVWAFTPMYSKDGAGLLESYTLALPFFRNSLLGDLAYTGLLFGAYALAKQYLSLKRTKLNPQLI